MHSAASSRSTTGPAAKSLLPAVMLNGSTQLIHDGRPADPASDARVPYAVLRVRSMGTWGFGLMVTKLEVVEVDELSTSIDGLDIEYVRTDRGIGPIQQTIAQTNDLLLNLGRMGFSATANTEIPKGIVVFGLMTQTPTGGSWCGTDLEAGQLFVLSPGTTFVGIEPAGLAATLLVVPVESVANAGAQLGIDEPDLPRCVKPASHRPEIAQ